MPKMEEDKKVLRNKNNLFSRLFYLVKTQLPPAPTFQGGVDPMWAAIICIFRPNRNNLLGVTTPTRNEEMHEQHSDKVFHLVKLVWLVSTSTWCRVQYALLVHRTLFSVRQLSRLATEGYVLLKLISTPSCWHKVY